MDVCVRWPLLLAGRKEKCDFLLLFIGCARGRASCCPFEMRRVTLLGAPYKASHWLRKFRQSASRPCNHKHSKTATLITFDGAFYFGKHAEAFSTISVLNQPTTHFGAFGALRAHTRVRRLFVNNGQFNAFRSFQAIRCSASSHARQLEHSNTMCAEWIGLWSVSQMHTIFRKIEYKQSARTFRIWKLVTALIRT